MNSESKISVHYSSLVGLKAELLKKQEEAKIAKAKVESITAGNKIKLNEKVVNKKEKKTKNIEAPQETDDLESMKTLKKSQLMLQAKSRLYDKLSKTRTNMNPNFLVDFEHKIDDPVVESEEETRKENLSDDDSDSEWVEYLDCFGRTRKCLREDLPRMKEKDESLKKDVLKEPHQNVQEQIFVVEDRTPEKEPEIEIMRRKWEEQTAKLANKADIHYQDILFDEARTHGVGYYAFSEDEKERKKQQEELAKLRKETEQKQKENESVRNIKEKMQLNRLRVARIRQRIRAGLSAKEAEEEIDLEDAKNQMQSAESVTIENSNNEKRLPNTESEAKPDDSAEDSPQEVAKNKLKDIENKIQAFGELLGKRNKWYVMTQEEWVCKKRKERDVEFAPNYENFQHGETYNLSDAIQEENASKQSASLENNQQAPNELSSDESDMIGPMPPSTLPQDSPKDPERHDQVNIDLQVDAGLKFLRQQSVTNELSSDESDMIGPMPPPTLQQDSPKDPKIHDQVDIVNQVEAGLKFLRQQSATNELSSDESDMIGPMPPPTLQQDSPKDPEIHDQVDIVNQVEAGLKFLRQQFENKTAK